VALAGLPLAPGPSSQPDQSKGVTQGPTYGSTLDL